MTVIELLSNVLSDYEILPSALLRVALFIGDTFCRRAYRIQDLLPPEFQQIYYNDVSATARFYAYDM